MIISSIVAKGSIPMAHSQLPAHSAAALMKLTQLP